MRSVLVAVLGTFVLLAPGAGAWQDPPAVSPPLTRFQSDLRAMESYRPGSAFWQQVFTVPDGSILFGSAADGRLLAILPAKGDWTSSARWTDPAFEHLLDGRRLPAKLDDRRDLVAGLLQQATGPIVHNPSRGLFVTPNARLYGGFLGEWRRIYERFGVPSDVGLAQALVESGLSGTRRSESRAVGFCQFLESNLRRLNTLASYVIEGRNQTAQAPFCAAYLSILSTKYGSFIPALSDHHSGGTNVGRTLINGERLGGVDVRDQYFMGSQLAHDLRQIDLYGYRDIYRTYGPRSHLYAEMVFGNIARVSELAAANPQQAIHAMRVPRITRIADITKRTGLTANEIRRFNPALVKQVPARATLYLPVYVKDFGPDVAFWHQPASATYSAVLQEFLNLPSGAERWDSAGFEPGLRGFQSRFRASGTEEGIVMATMLGYVIDEARSSRRREIIAEFRESQKVQQLFTRAVLNLDPANALVTNCSTPGDVQRVRWRAC